MVNLSEDGMGADYMAVCFCRWLQVDFVEVSVKIGPVKFACGVSSGLDNLHWNNKNSINCYSASLIAAEGVDDIEVLHCVLLLFCFYSDTPNFVEVLFAQNWKYNLN